MLRRILPPRCFYIGPMFRDAAARHGAVRVVLDQPLQLAPDRGVELTVPELAARLWAAGVRPGERVAIYKTHNFDIALLACAASWIGAVPAMLSPALDSDTVAELLRRLRRPWLVTDGEKLDASLAGAGLAGASLAELTREVLLSAGDRRTGTTPLAAYAGMPRRAAVLPGPREPALITHSSGTTDVPKLAVHCANSFWHRMMPQKLLAWPIRKRETVALCMTFVHSRFYNALRVWLDHGNPLVIAVDWDPERIGPLFARTRPGYVETHPNTFIEWEELVDAPSDPLSSVRYFGGTFDAMHPRTIRRLLSASQRPRPMFVQLYGQSETGPVTVRCFTRRGAARTDARCVGVPLAGFVRLRVVGPDLRPVRRGAQGHLEVRLRSRILTYLDEPDRYDGQLDDGWWRLGDMGFRDRWGRVYLLDREIDQIDEMDSNLKAEDLLLSRLEELREVAIVAGPDGAPVPVVCTRDEWPLDVARWERATRDLPPMAPPVLLPFDDVPRTSTWKVRRPELARLLKETR